MMPKGVEHDERRAQYAEQEIVKIPMMPKGVEHIVPMSISRPELSEDSNDAERR